MQDYKLLLTNVQYGEKIVPPITLIHLASQITTIPVEIIDSSGLSKTTHHELLLDIIKSKCKHLIVGISFMSREAKEAYKLTTYLKNIGVKHVIHGGVHPTLFPDESINSGADYIVIGEADNALPELINKIFSGETITSKVINSPLSNLKNINFLNWSYVKINEYSSYFLKEVQIPVFSARGCFGRCTFCYSSQDERGVRKFSKDYVFQSIKGAYKVGYRHFMFYDDDLLLNLPFLLNMAKELIQIFPEIKWDCMASVRSLLKAKEHLDLLIDNGMEGCHVGIESIDDIVLRSMKKTHNSKQGKDALQLLLESDLPIKEALLIALFENDTPFSHQLIVNEFVNSGISPSYARRWVQFATPLPGTPFQISSNESGITFIGFDTNYVNYIPNSFLNFDLGRLKIKSTNIKMNNNLMKAIKKGNNMKNSMTPKECRTVSYEIINHIYNQEIVVAK